MFHVYGTSDAGHEFDTVVSTNADGKFVIENLEISTYTIEEIGVADYYVLQSSQTVKVEWNKTVSSQGLPFQSTIETP